jgi:hypothetical protein
MVTLPTTEPQLRLALTSAETALRRLADYELDPPFARCLDALAERKESLSEDEHAELVGLVDFARRPHDRETQSPAGPQASARNRPGDHRRPMSNVPEIVRR